MSVRVGRLAGADFAAVVALDNPKRANALSPGLGEKLIEAFETLKTDSSVLMVVLTGKGKFFCTGMDLGNVGAGEKPSAAGARSIFETIQRFPKPVICAMNGPALGGGTGLVFACDFIIARKSAFFQFPEVKRGIVPALISAVIVPQLGLTQTRQLMMLGARVPAAEMHRLGAISCVVGDGSDDLPIADSSATQPTSSSPQRGVEAIIGVTVEQTISKLTLTEATLNYCHELLSSAPGALVLTKELCNQECDSRASRMDAAEGVFDVMIRSDEVPYGIGKFMAKETPDWRAYLAEHGKAKL